MNKAISISLAKVDYDLGQPYIKIIADNPQGYQFTQCIIEVHPIIDGDWGEIKRFVLQKDKLEFEEKLH